MSRFALVALLAAALASATTIGFFEANGGDDAGPRDIPAPFAPFEYLIGRWNGQGVPKDNPARQFRGWTETHTWAWSFAHGKPVGLTLTIDGGKVVATAKLTYDPARMLYRLEGTEPEPVAAPIAFEGTLDRAGKHLVLDQVGDAGKRARSAGRMRLSIWPNANFIRYTMAHDIQEPGSVHFTRLIEVGLTKEGESLAGGVTASERPKCIVTGGAANMTLSYQGRTFPICCTGCRDEFNENPEKYIKKASLMLGSQAGKAKSSQPATSRVSRFEDAFAGDVAESPRTGKQAPAEASKNSATADSIPSDSKAPIGTRSNNDAAQPAVSKKPANRAAALLKLGQNLEKSGKTTSALGYYRRVVKEFPESPAAKTAAERIKALDKP
jgi:YHS domain-containing protein